MLSDSIRMTPQRDSFFRNVPKVDLHRHLEGSLRLSTLIEVAARYHLDLPDPDLERLAAYVQVQPDDPLTPANFLSKFKTLRRFFCSPEVIQRVAREAVLDAAADNVRYLELRFTPVALSRVGGFSLAEVVDWVVESATRAAETSGVLTRLILSANRHESPDLAAEVAQLAVDRRADGVVGLDLAGDEANFSALPFAPIYNEARQAGLAVTIHAGEWSGSENIVEAIETFDAARIGHGVRVMEDASAVALARERGTVFEVCLTSNYQSGVVPAIDRHPLPVMLESGLVVTLNTDDPGISQITLSDEYRLAHESLALDLAALKAQVLRAAQATFLPPAERQALVHTLEADFPDARN